MHLLGVDTIYSCLLSSTIWQFWFSLKLPFQLKKDNVTHSSLLTFQFCWFSKKKALFLIPFTINYKQKDEKRQRKLQKDKKMKTNQRQMQHTHIPTRDRPYCCLDCLSHKCSVFVLVFECVFVLWFPMFCVWLFTKHICFSFVFFCMWPTLLLGLFTKHMFYFVNWAKAQARLKCVEDKKYTTRK